jgi:hypothetical protein
MEDIFGHFLLYKNHKEYTKEHGPIMSIQSIVESWEKNNGIKIPQRDVLQFSYKGFPPSAILCVKEGGGIEWREIKTIWSIRK